MSKTYGHHHLSCRRLNPYLLQIERTYPARSMSAGIYLTRTTHHAASTWPPRRPPSEERHGYTTINLLVDPPCTQLRSVVKKHLVITTVSLALISHVLLCPLTGTAHYMSAAPITYMVADSRDVHPNSEGLSALSGIFAPPTGVAMPLRMTKIVSTYTCLDCTKVSSCPFTALACSSARGKLTRTSVITTYCAAD